jgi:hypothetical protein
MTGWVPRFGTGAGFVVGLIVLNLAAAVAAGDPDRVLPRSFQQARLGMTFDELIRLKPELAKTKRRNLATVSVQTTPSDPFIQRILYRFHRDRLYEIEIRYRPDALLKGTEGLLVRLKESYGEPDVYRVDEPDISLNEITRRRTVWQDADTRITLLEREYWDDGNKRLEVTLTMTDVKLAQLRDADQEEQVRRKMEAIPIPLPSASLNAVSDRVGSISC